jgi:threonine dehydrogenase-like Zn-dependent dehydrogenase
MNGRIAIFKGPHKPFDLRDYPLPQPGPGDLLVKVSMSMVCGSDLHYWRGDLHSGMVAKHGEAVMGHEMVGRVHAKGAGITTDSNGTPIKEGDRVVYTYFAGCMSCPRCLRGETASCPNKKMFIHYQPGQPPYFTGGFADYFHLSRGNYFFKVPDNLPDSMVAPINCSFSQVFFGLHLADVRVGESLVIQGAGGLGLYAAAIAKERGANPIIVIDGIQGRLRMAHDFGADYTVDLTQYKMPAERVARVKEIVGPAGADVVVEVVGVPSAIVEGLQMTRMGGRYAVLGQVSAGEPGTIQFMPSMLLGKNIVSAACYDGWVLPKALDFLSRAKDKYPFDKMVSHTYPLADITKAFQDSEWSRPGAQNLPVTRTAIMP